MAVSALSAQVDGKQDMTMQSPGPHVGDAPARVEETAERKAPGSCHRVGGRGAPAAGQPQVGFLDVAAQQCLWV